MIFLFLPSPSGKVGEGSFSQTFVNSQGKISQNKDVEQVSVPITTLFAEKNRSFLFSRKKNNFTFA